MHRSKILAFAFIASLLPLAAMAGAPAGGPSIQPVFESGSPSGILIQEAGGFTYGYNMSGLAITGEGGLPGLPTTNYTLLGDAVLGWPDLDGNGITDLIVQDAGGFTYAYLLQDNGTFVSVLSEGQIPGLITTTYTVLGFPDLNGDGMSDIVQQEAGGFTYAYLMNGTSVLGEGALPGLPSGTYKTLGFPDLDGMNGDDMVIQEAGGFTFGYIIGPDGGTFVQVDDSASIPGLPTMTYSTLAFPDLDGQNGADIVIQEAGGFTYAYIMNGLVTSSEGMIPGLPTTTYSTIGFPDLDGDLSDDIVIQEAGGFTYAYLMNGLMTASEGVIPGLPTTTFATIGFPNLDDTNGADIVIQEAGGFTFGYLMNGTATVNSGALPGLPTTTFVTAEWEQPWTVRP